MRDDRPDRVCCGLRDAAEIEEDAYRLVMDVAEGKLSEVDEIGAGLAMLVAT